MKEEQAEELAANAFKDHVIKALREDGVYRHYQCGKPDGSSVYYFNITTFPGWLVVSGDIGELMVSRVLDMFNWTPKSVESISYFAEKVPHAIPTEEFCADRTIESMKYQIELIEENRGMATCPVCDGFGRVDIPECAKCNATGEVLEDLSDKQAKKVEEINGIISELKSGDMHEGQFWERWSEISDDYEISTKDYNSNFLWCREAVRWFFRNFKGEGMKEAVNVD